MGKCVIGKVMGRKAGCMALLAIWNFVLSSASWSSLMEKSSISIVNSCGTDYGIAPHSLEKLIYLGIWSVALLCLLAESLYLLYLGYINPREQRISRFDESVREWNYTTRAEIEGVWVYAGERELQLLLPQTSEVYLDKADPEAAWYSPMHYTGALNQSELLCTEFTYSTNVTIQIQVVSKNSSETWYMTTPSLPTVLALKEEVTEATCAKHTGFHDPVFGWSISFLKLQGICVVVTHTANQWVLDPHRPGCHGEKLNELALYERLPVPIGAQAPTVPIPASSLVVTVRSAADPLFAAYSETSGSFDFGVTDTVYKVVGVVMLGLSLLLLLHPIYYFSRKYRSWRRMVHKHFVEAGDESKAPSRAEAAF